MRKFLLSVAALAARILPASLKPGIYRIKPLAGLIRRGLNFAAPTGLNRVKVPGGDLAGFTILLELHCPEPGRAAGEALTAARHEICWMRHGFPVVPALSAMDWKAYILARPR